jgi:uncharacterized membrane protein
MFILIYKTTWDDSEKTFFLQSSPVVERYIYLTVFIPIPIPLIYQFDCCTWE